MTNWFGLAPPRVIELIVSDAVPVLDSVKVNGGLVVRRACVPKFWDAGESVTAACTPVPVSVTTCGLVTSESVMVSVPVRRPAVVGTKATLTRQLLPGVRLPPQLLLSEKFELQATPLIVNVVVPTLAIVTACDALLVPTTWLPNSSEVV